MKKFTLLFALLLAATCNFAQAPQAFNYQAVIRDAAGNLLVNQAIGLKIALLQDSAVGQEIYTETHSITTDLSGRVDLQIGAGTVVTGQFDTIAWASGPYYLQLAVDLAGGINYTVMGTTQMLSVPYALYAEEGSGWEKTDEGIGFTNGKVRIETNDTLAPFEINTSMATQGNYEIQKWATSDTGYNLRLLTEWDDHGINQKFIQKFNGIDYDVLKFYQGQLEIQRNKCISYGSSDVFSYDGRYIPHYGFGWFHDSWNLDGLTNYLTGYIGVKIFTQGQPRMVINTVGYVGIGTTNPTYPLSVNGTIRSKKVIVDTGWSDFVFEDDYSLMPLHKLEHFISKNKHLPEIPTAKEVEESGVSLGDMDAKLLQKIEELTLYTIQQQKMIEELVKQNKELGKKVEKLEKRK